MDIESRPAEIIPGSKINKPPKMEGVNMPTWLEKIISTVLQPLISLLAPELKEMLDKFIQDLYTKSKATSSPLDDMIVKIIADILGINVI